MLDPIAWLENNAPGFDLLPSEDRSSIMEFSLLWSLFEAQVLNTNGNAQNILAAAKNWESKGVLKIEQIQEHIDYFQSRYYQNNQFTDHFSHLHLRPNDKPNLVKSVIQKQDKNIGNIMAALLIIVYRFRNNLFHGSKWAYEIRDQRDNFNHANSLLMLAMDLHRL